MFKLTKKEEERGLHDAFEIGIVIKGLDGIAELIGGTLLLVVSPDTIQNIFLYFARGELIEDPGNRVLGYISHIVQGLSLHTQIFYGLLFVSHGVVKVFLVAGLMKNKIWAYPAAIAAFAIFVLYQVYQFSFSHSLFLALVTVVDVAVIWLIAHEYMEVRRRGRGAGK